MNSYKEESDRTFMETSGSGKRYKSPLRPVEESPPNDCNATMLLTSRDHSIGAHTFKLTLKKRHTMVPYHTELMDHAQVQPSMMLKQLLLDKVKSNVHWANTSIGKAFRALHLFAQERRVQQFMSMTPEGLADSLRIVQSLIDVVKNEHLMLFEESSCPDSNTSDQEELYRRMQMYKRDANLISRVIANKNC